jgi:y4mF family transcriptional regulator
MTLSEYIKQKRKKNGLSQVELAERAGVGLRFVRDLEQGKQTLRMDKVNDVLALFGECLGPVKTDSVCNKLVFISMTSTVACSQKTRKDSISPTTSHI